MAQVLEVQIAARLLCPFEWSLLVYFPVWFFLIPALYQVKTRTHLVRGESNSLLLPLIRSKVVPVFCGTFASLLGEIFIFLMFLLMLHY